MTIINQLLPQRKSYIGIVNRIIIVIIKLTSLSLKFI